MNPQDRQTQPLWAAGSVAQDLAQFPPLAVDQTADVCVIGAGIAGLSTAFHLARDGRSVVLLDDGPIAGGETMRTTAHLASYIDDDMTEIERLFGTDGLRLAYQSHAAAIDRIEQIVAAESIDCDFARLSAYLVTVDGAAAAAAGGEGGEQFLQEELEACHRAGLADAQWADRAPMPLFNSGRCLRFGRQGRFSPLRYMAGLARGITARGGRIHGTTHAAEVRGGKDAKVVTSQGRTISCAAIVVATNTPVNDLVAIHTKQAPYRTYVIAAPIARGSMVDALFWDTGDPYHYVRLRPHRADAATAGENEELLICGGEDHKTGQADDAPERYQRLEQWARQRWPIGQVRWRWSGQVMEPVDGVAFIGRNPLDSDNVFIATGDSGMGMTHGTIAGMLLSDLIAGRRNPWESLYNPSRLSQAKGVVEFIKENANVAAQYADWVRPGQVSSVDQIPRGGGAVLRNGASLVAVHRDSEGELHYRSAVCPHLKCIVQWNHGENSWDCPCHGSRFSATGQVLNGPANSDLPTAQT